MYAHRRPRTISSPAVSADFDRDATSDAEVQLGEYFFFLSDAYRGDDLSLDNLLSPSFPHIQHSDDDAVRVFDVIGDMNIQTPDDQHDPLPIDPLAEISFPLAESSFPLAESSFPLAESSFPLAESSFPLAERSFPLVVEHGLAITCSEEGTIDSEYPPTDPLDDSFSSFLRQEGSADAYAGAGAMDEGLPPVQISDFAPLASVPFAPEYNPCFMPDFPMITPTVSAAAAAAAAMCPTYPPISAAQNSFDHFPVFACPVPRFLTPVPGHLPGAAAPTSLGTSSVVSPVLVVPDLVKDQLHTLMLAPPCNASKDSKAGGPSEVLDEKASQQLQGLAKMMVELNRRMRREPSKSAKEKFFDEFLLFAEHPKCKQICWYLFHKPDLPDSMLVLEDTVRNLLYVFYLSFCRKDYKNEKSLTSGATRFSREAVFVVLAELLKMCMMANRAALAAMGQDEEAEMRVCCPELVDRKVFYTYSGGPLPVRTMLQQVEIWSNEEVHVQNSGEPAKKRSATCLNKTRKLVYERCRKLWAKIWEDYKVLRQRSSLSGPSRMLSATSAA